MKTRVVSPWVFDFAVADELIRVMRLIFFSLLILSSSAFAESGPNFQAGFDVDKIVSTIAPVARENLHRAVGEDGKKAGQRNRG